VFRLHGDRSPEKPRISAEDTGFHSGADNEIWCFGEEAYAIMKKFMLMRERLKPYIAKAMLEAHEKGTPPMRPLFYDYPGDFAAWEIDDEFIFGSDLLVAPVLSSGAREREVYLPAGSDWIDVRNGKTIEGGRKILCDAPIDGIPLFLKRGSSIGAELLR